MFPYTYSSSSALEGPLSHLIPWPFLDDVDDEQHQNLPPPAALATNMIMSNIGDGDGDGDGVPLLVQKKQLPWKRDRHSKIRTAQGLRDRRMRLSVKVARKFFDLQDRLDFDKGSKTIEWLLKNSEPAIKELIAVNNKYCISVSETNYKETDEITMQVTKPREKRKRRRAVARESRDKARARARERTREKIMARGQSNNESTKQHCRDSAEADPNHNLEFPDFITSNNEAGNEFAMDCYAMTSKKTILGNVQAQNNPNSQEHSPHHCSITNGQWNPSSIFGTTPNNPQMNPIPNSVFMNTNALELGNSSPAFTAINSSTIGFHSDQFLGNHFLL